MIEQSRATGPHAGQPILSAGAPLSEATMAMILLHGRGADAADIIGLAEQFRLPGLASFAPDASGRAWYPYRFIEPVERNEPWLSSALAVVADLIAALIEAGIPRDRIVLLGFSQGACLALEFAARHPARYGAVVGLSGGLIGAPGVARHDTGSLEGTPVFLGCSDVDSHIPLDRVQASTVALRGLGAVVDERIYPRMGHGIIDDEIRAVRALLAGLAAA